MRDLECLKSGFVSARRASRHPGKDITCKMSRTSSAQIAKGFKSLFEPRLGSVLKSRLFKRTDDRTIDILETHREYLHHLNNVVLSNN